MAATKHVLLGAGGAIATELTRELLRRGEDVRLISRSGTTVAGTESARADLLDAAQVLEAIPAGSVVYLLAGLPYDIRIWQEQWPRIMHNVLDACAQRGARLIFFDNIYMYGPVDGVMTEEAAVRPSSRKGEVRAQIATALLDASRSGRLRACIARSADFYGPNATNSVLNQLVLTPLSNGKTAQWIVNADVPHSFTYTPDCGRALPLLAAAEDAWSQVWHLPTAAPPLTGRQLVALAARILGVEPRLRVLRPWMLRIVGLFDRTVQELMEMLYQYDRPYVFDSSKFERRFQFAPTPYEKGIEETVAQISPKRPL
jgi:nucleoside-diphosphate-sugar epimerase